MKLTTKNPYIISLVTTLIVTFIQFLGIYLVFKESPQAINSRMLFNTFPHENHTLFIAVNIAIALAIIAIGYLYASYFKKPHLESRFWIIGIMSSILLALIYALTSFFLLATPPHSFTFFEIITAILRNFLIITVCLNIGELLHSFFQKTKSSF